MKKYFIFAAIATAGLFASCSSSDDIASNDAQGPIETPDGRVAIQVGVGAPGSTLATRGTGTAGGTNEAGDPNIWRGERINVLMYQLDPTTKLPTFNFTQGDLGTALYANTVMVTPLEDENTNSGIAKEPTDPANIGGNANTYKIKYYPMDGNVQSDFWGYYLGGYGTSYDAPAGNGILKYYEDNALQTEVTDPADIDDATVAATDFEIDGTHDLLVGQAAPADPNDAAKKYAYSAKGARAGVQPDIVFQHLLSRLQFKVKPGNENADGVQVTEIIVRSKTTGNVIVAYKYKDANGAPVAEPERIVWDASYAGQTYDQYPELSLKRRISDPSEYAAAVAATYAWVESDAATYTAATTATTPATSTDVATAKTTIAAAIAAYATAADENSVGDFLRFFTDTDADGNYDDGEQIIGYAIGTETSPAIPAITAAELGKMLPLAPVELDWDGGTPANHAETTLYTIPAGVITVADASALSTDAGGKADGTYTYYQESDKTYREVVVATSAISSNTVKYTVTGTETPIADDATLEATQDAAAATGTTVFFVGNTKYVSSNVTDVAVAGAGAVKKKVGEALLVAPQAKYYIEVKYQMDKQTARNWYKDYAGHDFNPGDLTGPTTTFYGSLKSDLVRTGSGTTGGQAGDPFVAGESYLVTITLYGPEEIKIKTTLTAWSASDADIEIGED